ncbi:MAG: B12-binding domain-containing protein [Eisenbergiella sp.]
MMIVGTKFKNNEVFVPEVLVAARAINAGWNSGPSCGREMMVGRLLSVRKGSS